MGVKLLSISYVAVVVVECVLGSSSGSFWKCVRALASKAKPFPHDVLSLLGRHCVDVHRVQVLLAMIKIEPSRSFIVHLLVIRVGSHVVPCVLLMALCIRMKLFWSCIAHLYHSSSVVGGVGRDMIFV